MSTLAQTATTYESPFQLPREGRVTALVHNQYNSPVGLYSVDNIAENIINQARILTNGVISARAEYSAVGSPVVPRSEVYRLLQEEEDSRQRSLTIEEIKDDQTTQSQSLVRLQKSLDFSGNQAAVHYVPRKESPPPPPPKPKGYKSPLLADSVGSPEPQQGGIYQQQHQRPATPQVGVPRRGPQSPQYHKDTGPLSSHTVPPTPQIQHTSNRAPLPPQRSFQSPQRSPLPPQRSFQSPQRSPQSPQTQYQSDRAPLPPQRGTPLESPYRQHETESLSQESFQRIPQSPQQQYAAPLSPQQHFYSEKSISQTSREADAPLKVPTDSRLVSQRPQEQQAPWRVPQPKHVQFTSSVQQESTAREEQQSQQRLATYATMAYANEPEPLSSSVQERGIARAWPPPNPAEQIPARVTTVLMSPPVGRNRPVWPPANTPEVAPKSTPDAPWSTNRPNKKFIWPPPPKTTQAAEPIYTNNVTYSNGFPPPPSPPTARAQVFRAPSKLPPNVWNPQAPVFVSRSQAIQARNRYRLAGDVKYNSNSTPLPPTYRAPPGTSHVDPYAHYQQN